MRAPLLSVRDLRVRFPGALAVDGLSFEIAPGETLGILGESGAGKSAAGLALMGLLDPPARVEGAALFDGVDLLRLSEPERAERRGRDLAILFQNPGAALNPIRRVGDQIADVLARHDPGARDVPDRCVEALRRLRVPDPERRLEAFPFELSGGLRQRIGISIALACAPKLLIADEPTTGLDVTTQAAAMAVFRTVQRERGMALILITHDVALAASACDRILVMRDGRAVETTTDLRRARHPYAMKLLASLPGEPPPESGLIGPPLVRLEAVAKRFPLRRRGLDVLRPARILEAIDAASFTIHAGEAVGLVGESGCGKSTLARIAARLIEPSAGRVLLDGADLTAQPLAAFTASPARRAVQMAFQDAGSSLNPRFSVFDAIADPVRVMIGQDREEVARRVRQAAARVELGSTLFDRLPHQLSGGEAARVGLARALAVAPRLLILDEPTASLDLAIQAQILALLAKLRREEGLALLFVSHDLSVVRQICDRILVMHLGQIVESGPAEALFRDPKHPYSQALIAAVPRLGFPPPPPMLTGEPQSPVDPDPNACRLYGRCVRQEERCRTQAPTLREVEAGRWARCHFV